METAQLIIRVPEELKRKFQIACLQKNVSMTEVLQKHMEKYSKQ